MGLALSVELAAIAQKDLATIHPLTDGNDRTARLLMNLILAIAHFTIGITMKVPPPAGGISSGMPHGPATTFMGRGAPHAGRMQVYCSLRLQHHQERKCFHKRWDIEENGFHQLKTYYHAKHYYCKEAVEAGGKGV